MSQWMTSGATRLKAKRNGGFAARAQQRSTSTFAAGIHPSSSSSTVPPHKRRRRIAVGRTVSQAAAPAAERPPSSDWRVPPPPPHSNGRPFAPATTKSSWSRTPPPPFASPPHPSSHPHYGPPVVRSRGRPLPHPSPFFHPPDDNNHYEHDAFVPPPPETGIAHSHPPPLSHRGLALPPPHQPRFHHHHPMMNMPPPPSPLEMDNGLFPPPPPQHFGHEEPLYDSMAPMEAFHPQEDYYDEGPSPRGLPDPYGYPAPPPQTHPPPLRPRDWNEAPIWHGHDPRRREPTDMMPQRQRPAMDLDDITFTTKTSSEFPTHGGIRRFQVKPVSKDPLPGFASPHPQSSQEEPHELRRRQEEAREDFSNAILACPKEESSALTEGHRGHHKREPKYFINGVRVDFDGVPLPLHDTTTDPLVGF